MNHKRVFTLATFVVFALLIVACGQTSTQEGEVTQVGEVKSEAMDDTSSIDDDVRAAYESVVSVEMPDVPIELVQEAKDDGTLVVYHAATAGDQAVVQQFREDFPFIEVSELEASNAPLLERFQSEESADLHIVDIVVSSDFDLPQPLVDEGFVAQYTPTSAANFPDWAKREGYTYPGALNVMAIGYNTNTVEDEVAAKLNQWDGLLDPIFQNYSWGLYDATNPGAGATIKASFAQYKLLGTEGWENIGATNPTLYTSGNRGTQALIAGEFDFFMQTTLRVFEGNRAQGAPIHYVMPEPLVVSPTAMFINANAPHPSAARLYQEWALSPRAAASWIENGSMTFLPDIPDNRPVTQESWYVDPAGREVFEFNSEEFQEEWPSIRDAWGEAILGE